MNNHTTQYINHPVRPSVCQRTGVCIAKELFLIRGLPGSGKTTFAKKLIKPYDNPVHLEADMYFEINGVYTWDSSKLGLAHGWCMNYAETAMRTGSDCVVVSNTFTRRWEMDFYIRAAEKYGYEVSIIKM